MPGIEKLENGKSVKNKGRKFAVDDEILKKLVFQKMKDQEIADFLNVSRRTIISARKRLGLSETHSLDKEKLVTLYAEGKTDKEIANELEISFRTVGMARQRLGLKANRGKGRPSSKPKVVVTEEMQANILKMLDSNYTPGEISSKYGLTKKDVIDVYKKNQPHTWYELRAKLQPNQQLILSTWLEKTKSIIAQKVIPFEIETLKAKIKNIKEKIDELPPDQKGCLPTPEVMARLGVRNAYLVDLCHDVEYVKLRHMIYLLEDKIEREYWKTIRKGLQEMDNQTMKVAERYLEEEIYTPFFASEVHGIMCGIISNSSQYKDAPGINLGTTMEQFEEVERIKKSLSTYETDVVVSGTVKHRGKGGGERQSLEGMQFWAN